MYQYSKGNLSKVFGSFFPPNCSRHVFVVPSLLPIKTFSVPKARTNDGNFNLFDFTGPWVWNNIDESIKTLGS